MGLLAVQPSVWHQLGCRSRLIPLKQTQDTMGGNGIDQTLSPKTLALKGLLLVVVECLDHIPSLQGVKQLVGKVDFRIKLLPIMFDRQG